MNSSSLTMMIVLICFILLSAYFSSTETAFSSLNRIRIKNLAGNGNKKAQLVQNMSEDYDKILSTILIGNNIVNIASASMATVLFVKYFGNAGVTLSTIVMTVLVLIFGEISPKSLAKEAPEKFAMFSAPFLSFFIIIMAPLNFIFACWKKLLSKVFKISADKSITEEELITIVEEAQQEGGIDSQEGELIRSAIEFNDLEATDVLTPRVDLIAVSDCEDKEIIAQIFLESGYSRLPVFHGTIDNIIGIINQKDFHNYIYRTNNTLECIIKPVVFITHSIKISRLLKLLQQQKAHIAVVVDEYGGTLGIVTLEDVIEELVGEIWDEHDQVVSEFVKISDKEYKVAGSANLDKMFKLFHLNMEMDIATVSGWVVRELGRIPEVGDTFSFEYLNVRVLAMDSRRVLSLQVKVDDKKRESDK